MHRLLPLFLLVGLMACSSPQPTPDPVEVVAAAPVVEAPIAPVATPPQSPTPEAPKLAEPAPSETASTPGADAGATVRAALSAYLAAHPIDRSQSDWRLALAPPPELEFPRGTEVEWLVETDAGSLRFRLLADTAPKHVANMIYLSEVGFYDGLGFHRVIPGFMAQGGCPLGEGSGGPGYRFAGEFPANGPQHTAAGVLSMANAGPGTDGSQFFMTFQATPWLDGKHTVFGTLLEGQQTLVALEKTGTRSGQPSRLIRIRSARVRFR